MKLTTTMTINIGEGEIKKIVADHLNASNEGFTVKPEEIKFDISPERDGGDYGAYCPAHVRQAIVTTVVSTESK